VSFALSNLPDGLETQPISQAKPPISPALVLTVGVLAVSVSAVLIRLAQREASSLVIAAARLVVASLVLLPLCLKTRRHELRQIRARDWWLALLSGVVLAAHFATWISSLEYTTIASSTVLASTAPLWVALVSPLLLQESLSRSLKVGLLLALAGSAVIAIANAESGIVGGSQPLLGNGLALLGAGTVAVYILIGRRLRQQHSLLVYTTIVYGMAAICMLLVVAVRGLSFAGFGWETYLLLVLIGVIPQLIGHQAFNWALAHLPATFISVTMISEPIGAGILAWLIFGESPGDGTIPGGLLIIAGIWLGSRKRKEK
jgi:drug/metabolite transporter (DMT)-like permease